jgi:hypothetical protein
MYNKIAEEIKQKYYQTNFSNDGQKFVAWYLRTILFRDMNETKEDITDGKNDKQIDAIVIDYDNSIIHIIQGKFLSADQVDAEPLREVLSSWIQLRNLEHLQITGNKKLQRKLSELDNAMDDDLKISFELITTSTLTESAQNDLETFQKRLNELSENEDYDATITVIDNEELKKRYEHSLDLFNNPIGDRTSPGKMLCILLVLCGCCLKTEVIKQLY